MSSHDELIDKVLSLTDDITCRREEIDTLHAERRGVIAQALSAGVGAQTLANALQISRQQVYKLAAKER